MKILVHSPKDVFCVEKIYPCSIPHLTLAIYKICNYNSLKYEFASQLCLEVFLDITAAGWYEKGLDGKVERCLEEAALCFDKALELDPKYVQAWYGKGDALYIMGRCGKKAVSLEKALVSSYL